MQLTVNTSFWTRYRSDSQNPDFADSFPPLPQAVPDLAVGQHTAIPRTNADTTDSNFLQAIANTAGFHFAWIEQSGTSVYASLAQRVNHSEVLRILLSIGGSEIMHFQTWQDKAGNAPPLTAVDPVTKVSVTFPDLNADGEILQTNLIMPEPTIFLDRKFPICSIIRGTETDGAATRALDGFIADGLFIGQPPEFLTLLNELAQAADAARHGGRDDDDDASTEASAPGTHTLKVNNGSGSGRYAADTFGIKVTADPPPPGKEFSRWIGDTDILANPEDSTTTATITSMDVTITATFKHKSK